MTEVPSKNVVQDFDLNLACSVLYVDLAGLNDGRAVKTILPRLNPRKLVCTLPIKHRASENLTDCDQGDVVSIQSLARSLQQYPLNDE